MKSEYLDLFDNYFSGTLEEWERVDLEKRIVNDAGLKEAFQEYRDLRNGIDYSIMKTLKEELQELEATLPEVELNPEARFSAAPTSTEPRFVLWKVAAVFIMLAVSVVVIFQLSQPANPQDLFTQYFVPAENAFVSPKRGDVTSELIERAFKAYDNGDHAEAIAGFNQILAEQEDIMVLFYLGNAQLALNQSQAAIATFERFLEISTDSVTEAKWYLALGYLKEGKVEETRRLLQELREDGTYGKDASRILRKLD